MQLAQRQARPSVGGRASRTRVVAVRAAKTAKGPRVAIVGVTGAVGQEFLTVLHERNFPYSSIKLLASARSAGKKQEFEGQTYTIEELTADSFGDVDIALFSAGGSISKTLGPVAAKAGAVVVDNSSAFRMTEGVPLVIPEVNPEAMAHIRLGGGGAIVANPNCSTIIALMAVTPLHRVAKDWRDEHLNDLPEVKARNAALPTFLYAMPFSKNKVFLEETSLVARPAVAFPDLKERLEARMKWLGIKVKSIEEEEYCLIPMGGVLPTHPQRVLGIGGTAGMVHPATGFMVSRMLGAAPGVADAIIDQLARPGDGGAAAAAAAAGAGAAAGGAPVPPASEAQAEAMSAAVWRAAWPVERLRQRAFFCFGMDVLLRLNLAETRQFFNAFFSLSDFHWQGFLSARLGFAQLIAFGLSLFAKSSNQARSDLLIKGLPGLFGMLAGLLPTLGQYYPPEPASAFGGGAGGGAASGSGGDGGDGGGGAGGGGGGGNGVPSAAAAAAAAAAEPVAAAVGK
ncbi:lycopene beta cyclase [Raphidocelis subcapitata]|uniref:lycopene beta-cyclase n=1 Tax=Raphidocelis subcapitata TaxID=307507 RepID=A0A2V0P4U5_9CHLO|nr:lycopene beta cyclase [Raphidocelis subcapitata]|eukprot:GBF92105.1 lycopene beta cyclase [Raphidocelis subcapitata]